MSDFSEWADERPVFNMNQAQRFTDIKRESLKVKLSRMVERGDLIRVEKGKYTAHKDSFIYASHIERPSYISLWSALDFYNLTTQQPTKVQVICSKNKEDLPKVSFHQSKDIFGYSRERYRSFEVFVAEKERLLIDILNFGEVPVDELKELVEEIKIQKLVEYANRFCSKAVSKRAGYLISSFRNETVEELKKEGSNYPVLDLTKSGTGKIDSEWKIKVNNNSF